MTEEPAGPAPQGESSAESAEAGEPTRGVLEESLPERPDLDARQERIRTERRAAGPPLRDEEAFRPEEEEEEEVPDVDPDEE